MTAPWPVDTKEGDTIQCGSLTFVRKDSGGSECWNVDLKDLPLTHFCVKNYGGEPNDLSGFTGWRVVSGGPFTNAGGWSSRDDAIRGATPWLAYYYRQQAATRLGEAVDLAIALRSFLEETPS